MTRILVSISEVGERGCTLRYRPTDTEEGETRDVYVSTEEALNLPLVPGGVQTQSVFFMGGHLEIVVAFPEDGEPKLFRSGGK